MEALIKRGLVFFAGAILLLSGSFFILDNFVGSSYSPRFELSEDYGYRLSPDQSLKIAGNRIGVDKRGMRNDPVPDQPVPGEVRILCLGDSITYGGLLTDQKNTYPALLKDLLSKSGTAASFQVLSASAPGWAIENEKNYIRHFGLCGSSIVVLQIGSQDLFQAKNTVLPAESKRSSLLFKVFKKLKRYAQKLGFAPKEAAAPPKNPLRLSRIYSKNIELLEEIRDYVRQSGADLLVVYLRQPISKEDGVFEADALSLFLKKFSSQGVRVMDLGEEFTASHKPALFNDFLHPNKSGNLFLAEKAASGIEEMLLSRGQ